MDDQPLLTGEDLREYEEIQKWNDAETEERLLRIERIWSDDINYLLKQV